MSVAAQLRVTFVEQISRLSRVSLLFLALVLRQLDSIPWIGLAVRLSPRSGYMAPSIELDVTAFALWAIDRTLHALSASSHDKRYSRHLVSCAYRPPALLPYFYRINGRAC